MSMANEDNYTVSIFKLHTHTHAHTKKNAKEREKMHKQRQIERMGDKFSAIL